MRPRSSARFGLAFALTVGIAVPTFAPTVAGSTSVRDDASVAEAQGLELATFLEHTHALGFYFDEVTQEHVVVVSEAGDASDIESRAPKSVGPLRVEPRNISAADIDEITGALLALGSERVGVFGFYFDAELGQVAIDGSLPDAVTTDLSKSFGTKVSFNAGEGGRDSRHSDIAPHWGGAEITEGAHLCSSGFKVHHQTNGTRYMVTAGHCFDVQDDIYSPGNGSSFGTVTVRQSFPAHDLEIMEGASYAPSIYVGGSTGTGAPVISAGDPAVGASYCRSGISTFEQCSQVVSSLNGTFCDSYGCTVNLIVYSGNNAAHGDSGAPFYLKSSGNIYIRGVHIAHEVNSNYAQKWSTVSQGFGVAIN